MTVKNKHGRKGVRKYVPQRPLDVQQRIAAEERGRKAGYDLGVRDARTQFLAIANTSRNIRDARRRMTELMNG